MGTNEKLYWRKIADTKMIPEDFKAEALELD